ncbi:Tetratricopeptide repeat protein 1 [Golovinomyces cichoracearum]|uniref:Tetratricopeptide repeat protein 1 n=1 Tax=Golovinomyces cichoracearum TaxID=62708 RepID=A0A420IKC0_9PEZI|nr:Tetratricopeptide repeat protein 1 [Golovinomyces cichoracearum]
MTSGTEDLPQDGEDSHHQTTNLSTRFSATEEASLLKESDTIKANANALFIKTEYNDAIKIYTEALSVCPEYLDYEVAILKSNVAACYLKLQNWKEATKFATAALERLEKLEKFPAEENEIIEDVTAEKADEEIVSAGAAMAEVTDYVIQRQMDIEKIKKKSLMRRARSNCEIGGWSSLQSAQEDYKVLSQMPNLSPEERGMIQRQMATLPARTKVAQDKEIGDLMGQLKNLGNGILKPFGLSTDNFKMQKDEKTGGYSMNFNQKPSDS